MADARVVAVICARIGSARLPRKILKEISGRSLLWHVIQRVRKAQRVDEVVVATTQKPEDDILFRLADVWGVRVHRGPTDDVLARVLGAGRRFGADIVVRVCADSPLIDPHQIDDYVRAIIDNGSDAAILRHPKKSARAGVDAAKIEAVEYLDDCITPGDPMREHGFAGIFNGRDAYRIAYIDEPAEYQRPERRLTIDTAEDLDLTRRVYDKLWRPGKIYHAVHPLDAIRCMDKMADTVGPLPDNMPYCKGPR